MSASMVVLPPQGKFTPVESSQKSLTHWVWTPYLDINNLGPFGIISRLGYRDHAWTRFERGKAYPLGNMKEEEPDRQAAEEAFQSGFSINAASLPQVEYTKYAQDQANELGEQYGMDHGLRILTVFTGIDDSTVVTRILGVVQSRIFDIHEMAHEFTEGARKRIRESNLSEAEKGMATELAAILLRGSQRAVVKASDEYERLISSMSDKSVGQPGISNPTPFHEWICKQLDKDVPARINRTTTQATGGDSALYAALLERDSKREAEMAELRTQMSQRAKPGPKPRAETVDA